MKKSFATFVAGCASLLLIGAMAHGEPVNEAEAVTVAEWWYAREVNARTTALPLSEKQARLAAISRRQVHYVLGRDRVQRDRNAGDEVMAYVVTFEPSGYVVVAGDDALEPVLAFNVTGTFRAEPAEKSYLSHFTTRALVRSFQQVRSVRGQGRASLVHTNWPRLKHRVKSNPVPAAGDSPQFTPVNLDDGNSYVLAPTASWNQGDHYNNMCVARSGGHDDVVTGCTATAMAIQMRYHQWPHRGNGSHAYSDRVYGDTFTHSVDFSRQTYDWTSMPNTDLTADNAEVAKLMYHCGVAVEMDYGLTTWNIVTGVTPAGSGAWPSADAMNNYFRYHGTIEISSSRPSDHVGAMQYSILCGLPTVMSSSVHTVVACGYRNLGAGYFYLNAGHGGGDDGWFALDQMEWGDDATIDRSYPYSSPNNYAFVDRQSDAWIPTGSLREPYRSFEDGADRVPDNGSLILKAGVYDNLNNTTITLRKPMILRSYLGNAIIKG